jgi:hypothetical protein
MKPRARRVTAGAAVLGAGVVAVLVVAHWATVCLHAEVWRFQIARKTETVEAGSSARGQPAVLEGAAYGSSCGFPSESVLQLLAAHSGLPVVHDHQDCTATIAEAQSLLPAGLCWWPTKPPPADYWKTPRVEISPATADLALDLLRDNGFRVLEQRFPRRAWVVIRDEPGKIRPGCK